MTIVYSQSSLGLGRISLNKRAFARNVSFKSIFFVAAVCIALVASQAGLAQDSQNLVARSEADHAEVSTNALSETYLSVPSGSSSSQDAIADLSIASTEPIPFTDLALTASAPEPSDLMPSSFDGGQIRIADSPKEHIENELILEGLVSYGNYKIFASGYDDKLYTAGIEYDRHSWGYFLRAQFDYVAEVLPFVLLDKPLHVDQYGNPVPIKDKSIRQQVYGAGISPIGFRLQWRSDTRFKPYLEAKGGMLGFTKKVPANQATYENFSLQSAMGLQVKMNEQWGIRLGLFSDFHFSNAFIVDSNPGLDVMNANLGIAYHF